MGELDQGDEVGSFWTIQDVGECEFGESYVPCVSARLNSISTSTEVGGAGEGSWVDQQVHAVGDMISGCTVHDESWCL